MDLSNSRCFSISSSLGSFTGNSADTIRRSCDTSCAPRLKSCTDPRGAHSRCSTFRDSHTHSWARILLARARVYPNGPPLLPSQQAFWLRAWLQAWLRAWLQAWLPSSASVPAVSALALQPQPSFLQPSFLQPSFLPPSFLQLSHPLPTLAAQQQQRSLLRQLPAWPLIS